MKMNLRVSDASLVFDARGMDSQLPLGELKAPTSTCIFSTLFFIHSLWYCLRGFVLTYNSSSLVIFSLILMTCLFDLAVLMLGEIGKPGKAIPSKLRRGALNWEPPYPEGEDEVFLSLDFFFSPHSDTSVISILFYFSCEVHQEATSC